MNDIIQKTIDEVFHLYQEFGSADYIGEPVSQIEHMSQSAQLALESGADDEVVLAAFFHDIGHLLVLGADHMSMGGYGAKRHEQIGADFLRSKGFPERVAKLVENHVQAKRYLTWKHPEYFNNLSEASRITLGYQGGVMGEQEAREFESNPLFNDSISLRRWDEEAKLTNIPVIDLNIIKDKARSVLGIAGH